MLFITAVNAMQITEPLGRGFELRDDCFLTNDKEVIARKLPKQARFSMGFEYINLIDGSLAIYWEGGSLTESEVAMDDLTVLNNWLMELRTFYQALWLVKDNAVNNELAFLFYHHEARNDTACCRNFLTTALTAATGTSEVTTFSLAELRQARAHFQDALFPLTFHNALATTNRAGTDPLPAFKVGAAKGTPRPVRFHSFLSGARTLAEIDVRISMYMTCLEILFSTSASEIVHKLSERVAFFLGKDGAERREIFQTMKRAYDIRSKIVHGDEIRVADSLPGTSVAIDNIIRRSFTKMLGDPALCALFSSNKEVIEEYMTELTLGSGHFTAIDNGAGRQSKMGA